MWLGFVVFTCTSLLSFIQRHGASGLTYICYHNVFLVVHKWKVKDVAARLRHIATKKRGIRSSVEVDRIDELSKSSWAA